MKRLILAILPILLMTQFPLRGTSLVPSDWKETLDFGVKWTSLLVNSFSVVANNETEDESIPEGVVTTTVAMTILPTSADFQFQIDQEVSMAQSQVARAREAVRLQKELNRRLRMLDIRVKNI
jgi:hypothetical protein